MFCNQCEQTSKSTACTSKGICGKSPEAAALQDVLTYALGDLAVAAAPAMQSGALDQQIKRFICQALFTTLTNVNFDLEPLGEYTRKALSLREQLVASGSAPDWKLIAAADSDTASLIARGQALGLMINERIDPDIISLQQLVLYGVRGIAAYAHHAAVFGKEDDAIYSFLIEALEKLNRGNLNLNEWLAMAMKCGEINLLAMQLLDAGNTETYGHPQPTEVPLGHRKGKAILVSGHDLYDLKNLLDATAGKGIDVYTHGEMLPAHAYPGLKKYSHLYGNFGSAWQNQKKEFATFPGPILMTTNCIQEPGDVYRDSIFTTGPVGWPGVKHLDNHDFSALIEMALKMPGFTDDSDDGSVLVGFARHTVMGVAGTLVEAIKAGDLRHIFLVGGCDGAKSGRNYFSDFVEQTPANTAVLTLGCGKYRFYNQKLGDIGGIPRLLDMGQCNDAYSAIQVAVALAEVFECGVNDLPLSLVLSWYEQKAVSILLTLLYLGIKDIRLGPSLPAFISPGILNVLVDSFGIAPCTEAHTDLATILA